MIEKRLAGDHTLSTDCCIAHTMSARIPAVIATGTPLEVDRYLVAALWVAEGCRPSLSDVADWLECLQRRREEFMPHESACWLCEHRAGYPPWLYPH